MALGDINHNENEFVVDPSISFVIATYNARPLIECCLASIRNQNYPQDKVEIIISDGGSSDGTLEVVKKYNCIIINNTKKLAEYGYQLGVQNATGEFLIIFAADNEFIGDMWLRKIIEIFKNEKDISAVWGRLASGDNDPSLNKYFELIQSDPLTWFTNNNLDNYRKRKTESKRKDYFVFAVDPLKPLAWGANGLVTRTKIMKPIWAQEGYLGDNDAFQYMIEQGNNRVAYFDVPIIYHHHVGKISDWIKKWRRNYIYHLIDNRKTRNLGWIFTRDFSIKFFIWIPYTLIPIFSLLHSSYLCLRDKNLFWFYHPIVSLAQFLTYASLSIFTAKGRNFTKTAIFGVLIRIRRLIIS